MPLLLQPVEEADLPRTLEIQAAAFASNNLNRVMFGGRPRSEETTEKALLRIRKELLDDQDTHILKVIDTDLDNKLIAFCKWHIYKHERSPSEYRTEGDRQFGPEVNVEVANAFFNALDEKRVEIMGGKPHCMLSLIDTDPDHQRRGAGSMLVNWGTRIADEERLPCYLEATAEGYPLYRKNGFEDVNILDMDLTQWGLGINRHTCMIRPAKD